MRRWPSRPMTAFQRLYGWLSSQATPQCSPQGPTGGRSAVGRCRMTPCMTGSCTCRGLRPSGSLLRLSLWTKALVGRWSLRTFQECRCGVLTRLSRSPTPPTAFLLSISGAIRPEFVALISPVQRQCHCDTESLCNMLTCQGWTNPTPVASTSTTSGVRGQMTLSLSRSPLRIGIPDLLITGSDLWKSTDILATSLLQTSDASQ
mmetsp:Transcript_58609/g.156709  ORF Transcript_58609/g.156709 Transcript_58609/m.156709 type:complete len:204 (+) Transcript_58609:684-1295(+)